MDVGQALRFPFADRRNVGPLLVAFVVSAAASVPFAAGDGAAGLSQALGVVIAILVAVVGSGYGMRIIRCVAEGEPTLLPSWRNWRGLVVEGLRFFVVLCAWILLFSLIVGVAAVGLVLAMGARPGTPWFDSDSPWRGLSFIMTLMIVPANLLLVPALARTAVEGSIDEGLRVPAIIGVVRHHFRVYALAALAIAAFDLARLGLETGLAALGWGGRHGGRTPPRRDPDPRLRPLHQPPLRPSLPSLARTHLATATAWPTPGGRALTRRSAVGRARPDADGARRLASRGRLRAGDPSERGPSGAILPPPWRNEARATARGGGGRGWSTRC